MRDVIRVCVNYSHVTCPGCGCKSHWAPPAEIPAVGEVFACESCGEQLRVVRETVA